MKSMKISLLACVSFALSLLINGPVVAAASNAELGHLFAEENCARCHAVDPRGLSPVQAAPPFRLLRQRYSMKDLAYKLNNGELGDYPIMPHWLIDPGDVEDLVSYIGTIQTGR